jgi:putative spermidine/putrescine transport system substrate-binding protein
VDAKRTDRVDAKGGTVTGTGMDRREFLRRARLTGAALALPSVLVACAPEREEVQPSGGPEEGTLEGATIKVGTYGGFFEENFSKMYPAFTEETGVEVESVSEPTSEQWVVQLEQATKAGAIPADVSMLSVVGMRRAEKGNVLANFSTSDIPNNKYLADGFVYENEQGDAIGVGAVSWYITLVSNTDRVKQSPDTWTAFWDPEWRNELALLKNPSNAYLLEVTAASFFDGYEILKKQDGVMEVLNKLAEVKPNVKLWFRDEGQAQQAYNTGEVSLGQFYHDITEFAASQGEHLRSVFPKEGAILDSGFWAITRTTENLRACVAFIDYMCKPEVQAELARTLGTSPTVQQRFMDLSPKEYKSLSGPGPDAALRPDYRIYDEWEDWINDRWTEAIVS